MHTLRSYGIGYVLAILITIAAYIAVVNHVSHLLLIIIGLAIVQLFLQLIFFLHIGTGPNARENIVVLFFALMVISIIVGGSLWIMNNLNYNMTPAQMNASMLDQAE